VPATSRVPWYSAPIDLMANVTASPSIATESSGIPTALWSGTSSVPRTPASSVFDTFTTIWSSMPAGAATVPSQMPTSAPALLPEHAERLRGCSGRLCILGFVGKEGIRGRDMTDTDERQDEPRSHGRSENTKDADESRMANPEHDAPIILRTPFFIAAATKRF